MKMKVQQIMAILLIALSLSSCSNDNSCSKISGVYVESKNNKKLILNIINDSVSISENNKRAKTYYLICLGNKLLIKDAYSGIFDTFYYDDRLKSIRINHDKSKYFNAAFLNDPNIAIEIAKDNVPLTEEEKSKLEEQKKADSLEAAIRNQRALDSIEESLQNYGNEEIQNNYGDRDKFIGTYTWGGECPRGCYYSHNFRKDGTVMTIFSTDDGGGETTLGDWTVDKSKKIIVIGGEKWHYKFKSGGKIKLTSCQYPSDTHELTREN